MNRKQNYLLVIFTVVFCVISPSTGSGITTLLADDFIRPDSDTVGSNTDGKKWTEIEIAGSKAAIKNHELTLSGGFDGKDVISASVAQILGFKDSVSASFMVKMKFKDSINAVTVGMYDNTNSGYAFFVSSKAFYVTTAPVASVTMMLASLKQYALDTTHTYKITVSIMGTKHTISLSEEPAGTVIATGTAEDNTFSKFTTFSLTGGSYEVGISYPTFISGLLVSGANVSTSINQNNRLKIAEIVARYNGNRLIINIPTNAGTFHTMQILTMNGKSIGSPIRLNSFGETIVPLNNPGRGVYFISILGSGKSVTSKFVVD